MTGTVSLLDLVERELATSDVHLPPFSKAVTELQAIAQDENHDIDELVRLITSDQALATEILRASNSAFYGGLTEITTIKQAIVRLGSPEVVRLAILATEKGKYVVKQPSLQGMIEPLWAHAAAVALGSRWLAGKLGYGELGDEVFLAGLLHDVGKLMLVKIVDQILEQETGERTIPATVIQEMLDTAHCEYGYRLVNQWQLPENYQVVVRDHHQEQPDTASTTLLIVRLVDLACRHIGIGLHHDGDIVLAASEEAFDLGATDLLLAEL